MVTNLRLGLAACLLSGAFFAASPASADFICMSDTDAGCTPVTEGLQFFLDGPPNNPNKDLSTFTGHVGGQSTPPVVKVDTTGNVDIGNGFANIKPTDKDTVLTDLLFTPDTSTTGGGALNYFSFRGQLSADAPLSVSVTVTNQFDIAELFTFAIANTNQDFARIGVLGTLGQVIKSVLITNDVGFKEVKQIEFDSVAPVPLPAALPLFAGGLGFLGWMARRRRGQAAHA